MALKIFSENKWHTFFTADFFDSERMKELKRVSNFASSLTASGEELELIKSRIENIPISKGNSCEWRQPFAEFILSNLVEAKDEQIANN